MARESVPAGTAPRFVARLCAGIPVPNAVTLVAAHPDDEVIGAGTRLPRLKDLSLIHVTDGAPRNMRDALAAGFATRERYAAARRGELEAALALAGIAPGRARGLGRADQRASLDLAGLAHGLAAMLGDLRPEIVITHPYEGGHPDHDATAFAVHAACRLLARADGRAPAIVEMTSYHNRAGAIAVFCFLPAGGGVGGHGRSALLSAAERALKRRMIACFASQQATLRQFPVARESFRPAPRYDFTRPPHAGVLYYEMFDWGMTGERWRQLAGAALDTLGLTGPP